MRDAMLNRAFTLVGRVGFPQAPACVGNGSEAARRPQRRPSSLFFRSTAAPDTAPPRLERRIAPRRNCAIAAELVFDEGRKIVPCIIRNVSDSGAKLELRSMAGIPQSFLLRGAGFQPQLCRVAWRALKEMGVEFQLD